MNSIINNLINYLSVKPKIFFLMDSLGAFFTAFFLFAVMRSLNVYFGMPEIVLTYLSAIAGLFCIYSFSCFLFLKERWALFIRIIAVANFLYCVATLGLLIKYYSFLTILGTTYFLTEIIVITLLGFVELKVARSRM
ncbi:hypothetical protein LNP04_18220 [Chryseobacterium sp. C-71]|uniref:hypothetical protein n=1 Tax=Chryseobacterium sp. C-71 TaxID=2893882 RepID=UPI001E33FB79|nr:hypothetical protein [Chryseobacterium sp. C-71]UFH31879.1 hypothetical protein LNP04_18220 [Chryseobacterium sp. C-71]